MDIGMEFGDAQLGGGKGGEDVFDLGEVEKKGARMKLDHGNEDASDSDEEPTSKRHRTQDTRESDLDSEDEREAKADYLERELDGLYDQYRERMSERDKKWKVRESRMKDAKREAWSGITEKGGSDDENGGSSDDGEESEEGGWDKVQEAKERAGEDSSSDDDEDDMPPVSKRQKTDSAKPVSKSLLTKLEDRKPSTSKAAQVWFGQDLFKGVADLDNIEDDVADTTEDVDMDEDASDEVLSLPLTVRGLRTLLIHMRSRPVPKMSGKTMTMTTTVSRSFRKKMMIPKCGMLKMRTKTKSGIKRFKVRLSSVSSIY
jgi:AdoMet-dependent rRNA methyltransferase SPB1